MNIIKAENYKQLSKKAATLIAGQLLAKPNSILGFATGSTPIGTYEHLVKLYHKGVLDFSKATTFNLDEYFGNEITDPNSYYAFMYENLFSHINIPKDCVHLPNGMAADPVEESKRYENSINKAGGIDLQLLGIGNNGHIGFNEPADSFADETHCEVLTQSTITANSRFYDSIEQVPKKALSMGIGTIMRAKNILLLASGRDKKDILEQALYGPVTPQVPASILQYHQSVTVICAVD